MRRDRHREIGQTFDVVARPGSRVIEAGGVPVASHDNHALKRKMAERLGIIQRPPIDLPNPEKFTDVDLGNHELPVFDYKQRIIESVRDNLITIVVAETGAGKSTQVPQFLLEEGYEVIMTQPRRLAAQMLSEQIEREINGSLGPEGYGYVGFHTARHNTINDRTRISVVTDGLRLVQELNERDEIDDEVLIIDEVHEWNKNMEMLIALVKKMMIEKPRLRVVIMSATIDADKLATFLTHDDRRPNIMTIPGRNHEVAMTEAPESDVVREAVKYATADKTVLVFLPGLREIKDTQEQIYRLLKSQNLHDNVKILSLHGDMSPAEQEAIGQSYHGPKIICATNVAQTSITIPDVDVVVDSGLERRIMMDSEGVEPLELNHISRADCNQRAGRCGRTHEGTYVLTRYISSEMRKKTKSDDTLGFFRFIPLDMKYDRTTGEGRLDYPIPEIMRTNADKSTLSMAAAGLNLRKLDLFHPIKDEVLKRSTNLLRVLGAFDSDDMITQRGKRMNEFPVRPTYARMLTYAEEKNFTQQTKSYLAAMVAVMEAGGLPNYSINGTNEWRTIAPERSSDYLSQLKLYLEMQDEESMGEVASQSLNPKKLLDARKSHSKLQRRMNLTPKPLPKFIATDQYAQLSDAVVSGMVDFVYRQGGGEYRRTSESLGRNVTLRVLSDRSLVRTHAQYAVGTPYKISAKDNRPEKHILQDVHVTTPAQLGAVALELCRWVDESPVWRDGKPKVRQRLMFRETVPIDQWQEVDATWSSELREVILQHVKQRPGPAAKELTAIKKELEILWHRTKEVERITQDEIDAIVTKLATKSVLSPDHLDAKLRQYMIANDMTLSRFVTDEERASILKRSPDAISWKGHELELAYKSGEPFVRHVTKARIVELLSDSDGESLKLPDGRKIYLQLGRKKQTLWQFAQDKKSGKL